MHNGGTATDTVVNSDGWQVVKDGAVAENTTVNQKGKLQVNAGGTATNVTLKQGRTGHQYGGNRHRQQPSGQFRGGKR